MLFKCHFILQDLKETLRNWSFFSSLCPVWRTHCDLSYLDLSMGSGPVTLLSSMMKKTIFESWKALCMLLLLRKCQHQYFLFTINGPHNKLLMEPAVSRSLCDNNTCLLTAGWDFGCGPTADKPLLLMLNYQLIIFMSSAALDCGKNTFLKEYATENQSCKCQNV